MARRSLLALRSHWPFEALARHLGRCLEARLGGVTGLLRYYDPRLFPLLFSHVLHPEQQQHWLRPAVFWSWLDRDGQGQRLAGTDDIPGPLERFEPIELSDHQVDILGCASDVTLGMDAFTAACPADWGRSAVSRPATAPCSPPARRASGVMTSARPTPWSDCVMRDESGQYSTRAMT
jgi:hypothetical protein